MEDADEFKFDPLVMKDEFTEHAMWCWKNHVPYNHWQWTCKAMGSHLNPQSFSQDTGHLILAPKG